MKKAKEPQLKCDHCPEIMPKIADGWHKILRFGGPQAETMIFCPECYFKHYGNKKLRFIAVCEGGTTVH
jgi:hypothetical protein